MEADLLPEEMRKVCELLIKVAGDTLADYAIEKLLGNGVYLAQRKNDKSKVAIKVIHGPDFEEDEVTIHKQLDHPNIVKFIDHFADNRRNYIILEYVEGTDLAEKRLSETEAKHIAKHLLEAVAYLHSLDIIHHDIAPRNILVDYDDNIKLCDFGASTFKESSTDELKASDVWYVGATIAELLFGFPLREEKRPDLTEEADAFLDALFTASPDDRPSAKEALGMAWLN